mmetsp:Transcript_43407/g.112930  ORF Transcript_43407/g.112930 Transcript_43407/m.112930 type:complete len:126 (-) Transcript_43407:739-1116(-)
MSIFAFGADSVDSVFVCRLFIFCTAFDWPSSATACFRLSSSIYSIRAIFPSLICTTLFAKYFRFTSCVTMIIVILFCMFSSTNMFITISVLAVSRSPVGSSRSSISGSLAIDLAIVTLCCSPPES